MTQALAIIIIAILTGLVLVALFSILRDFLRGTRVPAAPLKYVPFYDFFPPDPVAEVTGGVIVVGSAAAGWGLLHLAAGLTWAIRGELLPRTVSVGVAAFYCCFAAVLTGIGGVMLLRRRAYGRRMISWGQFLLAIVSFMGLAVALMARTNEDLSEWVRGASIYAAGGLLLYLALATLIGAAAQRVGRGPRAAQPQGG